VLEKAIVVQKPIVRGREEDSQGMVLSGEMIGEKYQVMRTGRQTQIQLLLEGVIIDLVCVSSSLDPYLFLVQAKQSEARFVEDPENYRTVPFRECG